MKKKRAKNMEQYTFKNCQIEIVGYPSEEENSNDHQCEILAFEMLLVLQEEMKVVQNMLEKGLNFEGQIQSTINKLNKLIENDRIGRIEEKIKTLENQNQDMLNRLGWIMRMVDVRETRQQELETSQQKLKEAMCVLEHQVARLGNQLNNQIKNLDTYIQILIRISQQPPMAQESPPNYENTSSLRRSSSYYGGGYQHNIWNSNPNNENGNSNDGGSVYPKYLL